jgi:hypothetical protein
MEPGKLPKLEVHVQEPVRNVRYWTILTITYLDIIPTSESNQINRHWDRNSLPHCLSLGVACVNLDYTVSRHLRCSLPISPNVHDLSILR